jgi:Uma2 family endonuclease
MAEPEIRRMSVETFLAWEPGDGLRYELVDGSPRAMGGARAKHARIVINAIMALRARLGAGPCEPFTDDIAVLTPKGNLRRPDVTVDCGDPDPEKQVADRPVLVIEVLSESTRRFDEYLKLTEYRSVASLRYVLLVEPDLPAVAFHVRGPDGTWSDRPLIGPETEIPLPDLGCTLTLADLYPNRS